MNPALEKIHSFGSLPPDWDGHGSDAISGITIAAAAAVLARTARWPGFPFLWAAPTSDETILMQVGSENGEILKFEIDGDGDIGVMRKSPGCEPAYADLRWTPADGFLGGTDWARALMAGEPSHPPHRATLNTDTPSPPSAFTQDPGQELACANRDGSGNC